MKKRIISGAVMTAVSTLVLILGLKVQTQIITAFIAIVAAVGVFEIVGNVAKTQNMLFKLVSAIYTVIMVFLFNIINQNIYQLNASVDQSVYETQAVVAAVVTTVLYAIVCGVLSVIYFEQLDLTKIATLCGVPLLCSFAFSTISTIVVATSVAPVTDVQMATNIVVAPAKGIYYLLLVLNYSCICDIAAYFVGTNLGKTKLCPNVSPNKTVEGALGGIIASLIVGAIITLCFGYFNKIIWVLIFSIPLCAAGMVGDLFASVIKRKADLKDFSNLIPGHGGIIDRLDSMLFVAPLLYCLLLLGVI